MIDKKRWDEIRELNAMDKIKVEVEVPCGRKIWFNKLGYEVCGTIEVCLHACPDEEIQGNVNGCKAFLRDAFCLGEHGLDDLEDDED